MFPSSCLHGFTGCRDAFLVVKPYFHQTWSCIILITPSLKLDSVSRLFQKSWKIDKTFAVTNDKQLIKCNSILTITILNVWFACQGTLLPSTLKAFILKVRARRGKQISLKYTIVIRKKQTNKTWNSKHLLRGYTISIDQKLACFVLPQNYPHLFEEWYISYSNSKFSKMDTFIKSW